MIDPLAQAVHSRSIIIDAVCPLVLDDPQYLEWYRSGGASTIGPTISTVEGPARTLERLAAWHRLLREDLSLSLVRSADEVIAAKANGRLGLYFHMQGAEPVSDNLDLVDLYKALGVGMIQLTYNVRNRVGDGCEEPGDAGLSRFGERLVERLNAASIIVDCSHTSLATSLDAIARSSAPVVLSHSNLAGVHDSLRNAPNRLVDEIAASGGVIGIVGFPAMVSASTAPSLDQFLAHVDGVADRVGIDHVGLGIDYYWGQAGIATLEAATASYEAAVRTGIWSAAYPPPPHHYPAGIETPRLLANLTEALLRRGYSEHQVQQVLGENWLRVMRRVWG